MSYAIKEMFLTLQGEGVHCGRRAVFLRFTGCNLWTGLEKDRLSAVCQFCDTDFVGMDGEGGGRFANARLVAASVTAVWGASDDRRFVVITGGEPMLQVDNALIDALHDCGFEIAIESNGTIAVPRSIDWICISPKAGSETIQKSGDEVKLVWPQPGSDWEQMQEWDFSHHLIQPMDDRESDEVSASNLQSAIEFVQANPKWRLSLQTHKILGLA